MGMFNRRTVRTIDTFPFGHVTCPISVDSENECLETRIEYSIADLTKLIEDIRWYYALKSDQSQRQSEISDLAYKLAKLLGKEKSVHGRIWSPIKIKL